jgi:hypothetical protein
VLGWDDPKCASAGAAQARGDVPCLQNKRELLAEVERTRASLENSDNATDRKLGDVRRDMALIEKNYNALAVTLGRPGYGETNRSGRLNFASSVRRTPVLITARIETRLRSSYRLGVRGCRLSHSRQPLMVELKPCSGGAFFVRATKRQPHR